MFSPFLQRSLLLTIALVLTVASCSHRQAIPSGKKLGKQGVDVDGVDPYVLPYLLEQDAVLILKGGVRNWEQFRPFIESLGLPADAQDGAIDDSYELIDKSRSPYVIVEYDQEQAGSRCEQLGLPCQLLRPGGILEARMLVPTNEPTAFRNTFPMLDRKGVAATTEGDWVRVEIAFVAQDADARSRQLKRQLEEGPSIRRRPRITPARAALVNSERPTAMWVSLRQGLRLASYWYQRIEMGLLQSGLPRVDTFREVHAHARRAAFLRALDMPEAAEFEDVALFMAGDYEGSFAVDVVGSYTQLGARVIKAGTAEAVFPRSAIEEPQLDAHWSVDFTGMFGEVETPPPLEDGLDEVRDDALETRPSSILGALRAPVGGVGALYTGPSTLMSADQPLLSLRLRSDASGAKKQVDVVFQSEVESNHHRAFLEGLRTEISATERRDSQRDGRRIVSMMSGGVSVPDRHFDDSLEPKTGFQVAIEPGFRKTPTVLSTFWRGIWADKPPARLKRIFDGLDGKSVRLESNSTGRAGHVRLKIGEGEVPRPSMSGEGELRQPEPSCLADAAETLRPIVAEASRMDWPSEYLVERLPRAQSTVIEQIGGCAEAGAISAETADSAISDFLKWRALALAMADQEQKAGRWLEEACKLDAAHCEQSVEDFGLAETED